MLFGKKQQVSDDPTNPLYEMQNFTRRETIINPYRHMVLSNIHLGTSLGGNPLEFLRLSLTENPVPLEVPLETVNAVTERSQASKSIAECLDDLGIMRPFEIKVLREAEKMDTAVNDRYHTDRAIRLISKYLQWSHDNLTCTEMAHLFCRMGLLSVFFPQPLVSDAIKGDPFLTKNFGKATEPAGLTLMESLEQIRMPKLYLATIRLAEEKDKLPKAFEVLANMEQE